MMKTEIAFILDRCGSMDWQRTRRQANCTAWLALAGVAQAALRERWREGSARRGGRGLRESFLR